MLGPKGDTQTVNSAELHGLIKLLKYTRGYFKACSDSYYVYSTFCKGRLQSKDYHTNPDQWLELWDAVDKRGGSVDLSWCPSHKKAEDIDNGIISHWQFYSNYFADKLAGYAAEACQLK